MKYNIILLLCLITLTAASSADLTTTVRKKGHYGLHGIIYKSSLMSLLAFIAIKVKVVIIAAVAFAVFVLGAKVWATYRYGNLLFNKECHGHDEVFLHHPPPSFSSHEYVGSGSPEFEGGPPGYSLGPPGYSFEKH